MNACELCGDHLGNLAITKDDGREHVSPRHCILALRERLKNTIDLVDSLAGELSDPSGRHAIRADDWLTEQKKLFKEL
jgi:hypothetical protein